MTLDRRTALLLAGSALAATAAGPALAALLARPTGDVILTVTGAVTSPNIPEGAAFDLTMLDALPQYETATETPWHDGTIRFQGPLIADVLAAAGADGSLLRVIALNDYAADIPIEDIRTYPVILASRINGEPIAVRNKGPLFVIYPFDRHPELVNELFFSRSVWQVKAINVSG
jgi:hypothetical protein